MLFLGMHDIIGPISEYADNDFKCKYRQFCLNDDWIHCFGSLRMQYRMCLVCDLICRGRCWPTSNKIEVKHTNKD